MTRNGFVAVVFAVACSLPLIAQVKAIDPTNSKITIHAYKTGMFSFAGHDHVIEAPITSGQLDENDKMVTVEIETKNLRVLDPGESENNRAEIQQTMLSRKLLDAQTYPEISFRSGAYRHDGGDSAEVQGKLSLHGEVRLVTLTVRKDGGRWIGSTTLKQTDFGMHPVSVAGGTVKVKDEVKVEFSVAVKP
ncbi:MAG TPA: YceI family protein [Terriglobales bacterium]|nr:YceI family protein [Terriglobales bacterium]